MTASTFTLPRFVRCRSTGIPFRSSQKVSSLAACRAVQPRGRPPYWLSLALLPGTSGPRFVVAGSPARRTPPQICRSRYFACADFTLMTALISRPLRGVALKNAKAFCVNGFGLSNAVLVRSPRASVILVAALFNPAA